MNSAFQINRSDQQTPDQQNRSPVFIVGLVVLLMSLTGVAQYATAQQQDVDYRFKKDTVAVERGASFSNTLVITNNTKETVRLASHVNQALQNSMLKIPPVLILAPGDSRLLPVKFFAERGTIQEELQEFKIGFSKAGSSSIIGNPAVFYTRSEAVRRIVIGTASPEVYLPAGGHTAELPLRLLNNSLIAQSFTLDFEQVPEGLEISGDKGPASVNGGEELMKTYVIKDKRGARHTADFSVIIRAVDTMGQQLDRKVIRVMSLSGRRSLSGPEKERYGATIPHSVSVSYLNANTYSSVQLSGNGNYELGQKKHLVYNVNADYLTNGANRFTMYNSFVTYQSPRFGLKAGNIYQDLDFNVNGIGGKGTYYVNKRQRLHVYGLKNNYLLYADRLNSGTGGNTFAAEYIDGDRNREKTRIVALHNNNTMNAVKTDLVSGKKAVFSNNNTGELNVEGGISTEKYDHILGERHKGFAFGADYTYKRDALLLSTRQYYGSPYYGGMRRGSFQSENTASYTLSTRIAVNGRLSIMDNRPRYLVRQFSDYLMRTSSYGNQIYETGIRISPAPHWQLALSPYYFRQSMEPRNYFPGDSLSENLWRSRSLRVKLNVSYSAGMHAVSLMSDQGYTYQNTSGHPAAPFYTARVNLNYSNRYFGVDGFFQHNPYFLSDALVSKPGGVYNVFSVGVRSQFNALKDRLGIHSALRYYNYGYNHSQNYVLDADVRYQLPDNWAVTANAFLGLNRLSQLNMYDPEKGITPSVPQYTGDQASLLTSRQISVGISKRFGKMRNSGERKLTLVYFEDRNGNGRQDTGEPVVSGLMVTIDGLAAVTGKKGTVIFDAPAGKEYTPAIVSDGGWTQSGDYSIFLSRNKTVSIPLVRSGRLSGKLQKVAGTYIRSERSLSGIRIKAVNGSGRVYQTLTDNEGHFGFYLPETDYTVSVETEGQSITIEGGSRQVQVQKDTTGSVIFHYIDQRVEVDVKKF